MGSQTSSVVLCMQNRTRLDLGPELLVSKLEIWSQTSSVDLCIRQNSVLSTRITSLYGSQTSSVDLCTQNSVLRTKIKSLWVPDLICGFVHAKQRDFSTRITSLYGSQTSSVDLCTQNSVLSTRKTSLYGSSPHLWICAKQRL